MPEMKSGKPALGAGFFALSLPIEYGLTGCFNTPTAVIPNTHS
jgi:hypothetical protein